MFNTNLPLRSIPTSPPLKSGVGVPRAQDLSVTQLQQKKDRQDAAVSMSQLMDRKAGLENTRTTSVAHIGQTMTAPSTSITHAGASVDVTQTKEEQEAADNRRYAYMREQIKKRQEKEAADVKKQLAQEKSGLHFGTGSALRKTGVTSVHKQLSKEFRTHRTTYGAVSSKEKKIFEEVVTDRLSKKALGSKVSIYDRKTMKKNINKEHDTGNVTLRHAKTFKKLVDKIQ